MYTPESIMSSKYDTKSMRDKLRKKMAGKAADPNEFRAPKSTGDILKFRFFILPPMQHGEPCIGPNGPGSGAYTGPDMDFFYLPYGSHWVNSRPYTCPRVISDDAQDCKMCATGFSLFKELKAQGVTGPEVKAQMRAIARQWLPVSSFMVNIYFPASQTNPEELHNRVMWFRASKTVWQHWSDALNRDDLGDPEDPQAFGAFFDEEAAFMYELQVGRSGEWNEYKTSKFIVGSRGARPIAVKSDGSPDLKEIKRILGLRHDLYTKLEPAVEGTMDKLANQLIHGDDSGFDEDETKPVAAVPQRTEVRVHPLLTPHGGRPASPVVSQHAGNRVVDHVADPDLDDHPARAVEAEEWAGAGVETGKSSAAADVIDVGVDADTPPSVAPAPIGKPAGSKPGVTLPKRPKSVDIISEEDLGPPAADLSAVDDMLAQLSDIE